MESFQELRRDDTFCFSCHPDIVCFNSCCGDLNQFLTPYDILRLKNRLKLSSQQFLKKFTERHIGPRTGLPVVSLKMPANNAFKCPFVNRTGCTVYEDRPAACRTYPLGRIAARKPGEKECTESYFLMKETHCLGFSEGRKWTIHEWKKSQALETYNQMNDLMMDIISLKNRSTKGLLSEIEIDLFCMACYDLDRFRDFVFEKRLWENSCVAGDFGKPELKDDMALMRFGIEWIKKLFENSKDRTRNDECRMEGNREA